jgi:peptide subunit release factor 1 (eRF1)
MYKFLETTNINNHPNGLLLYVGVFGKNEQVLVISIPPVDKIDQFTYSCEIKVDTDPLFQMIKPKTSMIFAIVDGKGIKIFSDIQGVQSKEYSEDYFVVRFQNHGG